MKFEIIDNFLTSYHADTYIKTFDGMRTGSGLFTWVFINNVNRNERGKDAYYLGNYYFCNTIINEYEVWDTHFLPLFNPILDKLKVPVADVYRLKVNLYPRTQRRVHHCTHTDYEPNSGLATALYFVNDNDGVTIFNRKKTIKSKENRIILFDGSNKHHPTTPTNVNWRSTINIDYIKKPGGERVWVHREHEYV